MKTVLGNIQSTMSGWQLHRSEFSHFHLISALHMEEMFCLGGSRAHNRPMSQWKLLNTGTMLAFLLSSPQHQGPQWKLGGVSGAGLSHSPPLWCWGLTHTQHHLAKGQPAHRVQSPADLHPWWTGPASGLSSGRQCRPLHLQGHKSSRDCCQALHTERSG